MDLKIEKYLNKQTKEHREIIERIRSLILTNFPGVKETGMEEGLWYEGKFYLATIAGHINLGVGVTGLTGEEVKQFEGKGKSMRHLKFFSIRDIDEKKLLPLLKLIYDKSCCSSQINWKK